MKQRIRTILSSAVSGSRYYVPNPNLGGGRDCESDQCNAAR